MKRKRGGVKVDVDKRGCKVEEDKKRGEDEERESKGFYVYRRRRKKGRRIRLKWSVEHHVRQH